MRTITLICLLLLCIAAFAQDGSPMPCYPGAPGCHNPNNPTPRPPGASVHVLTRDGIGVVIIMTTRPEGLVFERAEIPTVHVPLAEMVS